MAAPSAGTGAVPWVELHLPGAHGLGFQVFLTGNITDSPAAVLQRSGRYSCTQCGTSACQHIKSLSTCEEGSGGGEEGAQQEDSTEQAELECLDRALARHLSLDGKLRVTSVSYVSGTGVALSMSGGSSAAWRVALACASQAACVLAAIVV